MSSQECNKKTEEIAVYEALRNSIVSIEERVINTKCYMYVLYFTLLGFGLEFPHLLITSYLVLIVFQTMINGDKLGAEKASTYIRIFFEESREIHWESLHKDPNHYQAYKKVTRDIGWYIDKYSAVILAVISFILFALSIHAKTNENCIMLLDVVNLFISFLLCALTIYINIKQYSNNGKDLGKIEETIREFKTACYRETEVMEMQTSGNGHRSVVVPRRKIVIRRKVRGGRSARKT